ncbi:MAG TPA: DUF3551 domain-containing protein [Xanthobacteraceae bacterium]|jgi:hypothetical protein|nr:DUF3551 domain-containing protein [Xanthobacteraceae bacterium]
MRTMLFGVAMLAASAAMAATSTAARAQNYPWCAFYDTGDQAINCGFVSREQCMATVSGIGGFCMPNNTYQPLPPSRRR